MGWPAAWAGLPHGLACRVIAAGTGSALAEAGAAAAAILP
jgi:hypothetical protein